MAALVVGDGSDGSGGSGRGRTRRSGDLLGSGRGRRHAARHGGEDGKVGELGGVLEWRRVTDGGVAASVLKVELVLVVPLRKEIEERVRRVSRG